MALFSRRTKDVGPTGPPAPIRSLGLQILGGPAGWALLTGPRSDGPDREIRCDDETLAATLPATFRSALAAVRATGIGPLPRDAAAHPWVGGDWLAATAAGVRSFTMALGSAGLTVIRDGLTVEAPSAEPFVEPIGRRATDMLSDRDLAGWADLIEAEPWSGLPVWDSAARFLLAGVRADGLVSGWWNPDPLDFSQALSPLREEFVKESVTLFLKGTEWKPDSAGPPAHGFADPGVAGRWLWLYHWRPFTDGDTFPGAFGLVLDDDQVLAFHWADRSAVQRVRVRGADAWPVADRSTITGVFRELAGPAELPPGWEVHDG